MSVSSLPVGTAGSKKGKPKSSKHELIKLLSERVAKAEQAVEDAKAKLDTQKKTRLEAEQQLETKMKEITEIAEGEKEKIKSQVKEKLEDSVKRIKEEKGIYEIELKKKLALLKERDFMVNELESMARIKGRKIKERTSSQISYEADLQKLRAEAESYQQENGALTKENEEKKAKIEEFQRNIAEMKLVVEHLTQAQEGLNKYLEGSTPGKSVVGKKEPAVAEKGRVHGGIKKGSMGAASHPAISKLPAGMAVKKQAEPEDEFVDKAQGEEDGFW